MKPILSANYINDYHDVIVEIIYCDGSKEEFVNPPEEWMNEVMEQITKQQYEGFKE